MTATESERRQKNATEGKRMLKKATEGERMQQKAKEGRKKQKNEREFLLSELSAASRGFQRRSFAVDNFQGEY